MKLSLNFWRLLTFILIFFLSIFITSTFIFLNKYEKLNNSVESNNSKVCPNINILKSCTYGRYGIRYTEDQYASFHTKVFRHTDEIKDSEGNFVGYRDSTLRINTQEGTFVLDVWNNEGDGVSVEGTYTTDGAQSKYVLSYDKEKYGMTTSFEFDMKNYALQVMEYAGDNVSNGGPTKGDLYEFYWME